jgi:hypothetical protein
VLNHKDFDTGSVGSEYGLASTFGKRESPAGKLIGDPAGITERLHGGDVVGTRAKSRLRQEAHGGVGVGRIIRPGRRRGRRRERLRAVGQREMSADFAVGKAVLSMTMAALPSLMISKMSEAASGPVALMFHR